MSDVVPFFKEPSHRGSVLYRKSRQAAQERSGGRCEARIETICMGWGSQAHHRLRRSQGGSDLPENLIWICTGCHDYAHDHPEWAMANGLLEPKPGPVSSAVLNVERVR